MLLFVFEGINGLWTASSVHYIVLILLFTVFQSTKGSLTRDL
uniref:Uncharacterized protein n=1 Tax=Anguilla anguilla TaxID=7936 RepID=A0A0E9W612_ANGAN